MAINEIVLGPIAERVVANVKRLRQAAGLSLADLAERLDAVGRPIRPTGLSRLENGRRRVDPDDLVGLALALDVSPISLLMPFTAKGELHVTERIEADALAAWDWMRALRPLQLPEEREEAAIVSVAFQGRAVPMGARALGDQLAGLYERSERRPQNAPLDWQGYDARHPEPGEGGADDGQHREEA